MVLKCLGFAAAAVLAFPAAAQMVRAQDPQSVVRAMEQGGHSATLGVDRIGDPKIESSVSGRKFQVFFYNCTAHQNCATIQFHSGYAMPGRVTLERINDWNNRKRFGRAFLDKVGHPVLEMDLDLDDGGLSTPLFLDNLEFWDTVLGEFERHIGFQRE